ncbi:MAG TPA: hypothetical protein VFD38_04810 [Myxococcaceae bacterium]|nr:hypothetical protein [Myxococcaceae bacterium]
MNETAHRLRTAAPALAMVLVALLGLGFQLQLPRAFPSDADYRGVAAALAGARAPGDVVLLHPWWTERARLFLPPDLPVVGYLGDTADDLLEHPRIWVLANERLPRTPDADLRRNFLPDRGPLSTGEQFGPLTLTPYRNGRARRVVLSVIDAFDQLRISVEGPAGAAPQPCQRSGTRVQCPFDASVEVAWHEVLYQPVRCLYVLPPSGGRTLSLRLPDGPAAAALLLEAGITWEHAWFPDRAAVELRLESPAGVLISKVPAGHEGFVRGETPAAAAGPWTLRLTTANPHDRQLCLRLRALGGPP